jgi:hypothetical protein
MNELKRRGGLVGNQKRLRRRRKRKLHPIFGNQKN